MECGGKQSATPLFLALSANFSSGNTIQSGVALRLPRLPPHSIDISIRFVCNHTHLARLNYTHRNAVKHRLVPVANQYPWCSAAWFERTAAPAQVKTIYSFNTEKLNVFDEYTPSLEW